MKKLFLSLVFLFTVSFSFANSLVESKTDNNEITTEISLDNYILDSQILNLSYDICTITVSIYQNGVLVASATWTDNTGDCELARAGARMMAFNQL